jgi:hypothetical protein
VIHSRVRSGNSRAAAISISSVHFLFTGITRVRRASFDAFREIASFGLIVSSPKSRMRGTIPAVDTVIRRSAIPTPSTSSRDALMKFS